MATEELDVIPVYIGWDEREDDAFWVCRHSVIRNSSWPVFVVQMKQDVLRYIGLYDRQELSENGQKYDVIDGKPFSTEFSFTRFLVPAMTQYKGWAVFMDCDMLMLGDVSELLRLADDRYAVMVVKHNHIPPEESKMDDQIQTRYRRKNWSSFVLWNCAHPSNFNLSVDAVNKEPGAWLHAFSWLKDEEIGELPLEWNYLVGYNSKDQVARPKNIHYTVGGPWFDDYQNVEYADEWRREKRLVDFKMKPSQVEALTGGKQSTAAAYRSMQEMREKPRQQTA